MQTIAFLLRIPSKLNDQFNLALRAKYGRNIPHGVKTDLIKALIEKWITEQKTDGAAVAGEINSLSHLKEYL